MAIRTKVNAKTIQCHVSITKRPIDEQVPMIWLCFDLFSEIIRGTNDH